MSDSIISARELKPERRAAIAHWIEHNWPHPSISNEADEEEWFRAADLMDHVVFLEEKIKALAAAAPSLKGVAETQTF